MTTKRPFVFSSLPNPSILTENAFFYRAFASAKTPTTYTPFAGRCQGEHHCDDNDPAYIVAGDRLQSFSIYRRGRPLIVGHHQNPIRSAGAGVGQVGLDDMSIDNETNQPCLIILPFPTTSHFRTSTPQHQHSAPYNNLLHHHVRPFATTFSSLRPPPALYFLFHVSFVPVVLLYGFVSFFDIKLKVCGKLRKLSRGSQLLVAVEQGAHVEDKAVDLLGETQLEKMGRV